MGRFKNLKNHRFGKLIVLERSSNKNNCVRWKCVCDCGNESIVKSANLLKGDTKTCGCGLKVIGDRVFKDLTNQKFGKLLAIKRSNKIGICAFWHCRCDCGNEIITRSTNLRNGKSRSCGCNMPKGDKNHFWNPKISFEDRNKRRLNKEYHKWQKLVKLRDNFTCQKCNLFSKEKRQMHAHHINGHAENIKLRYEINNGITLCMKCHLEFHKIYGKKNNDDIQFIEFMKNGK